MGARVAGPKHPASYGYAHVYTDTAMFISVYTEVSTLGCFCEFRVLVVNVLVVLVRRVLLFGV